MVDQIMRAIESLRDFPHRTVYLQSGLNESVRTLPVKPYVIFFRVLERDRIIKILAVRHGARRRPRRFD
jgi:plasmid stabilization system protein ParE